MKVFFKFLKQIRYNFKTSKLLPPSYHNLLPNSETINLLVCWETTTSLLAISSALLPIVDLISTRRDRWGSIAACNSTRLFHGSDVPPIWPAYRSMHRSTASHTLNISPRSCLFAQVVNRISRISSIARPDNHSFHP